MLPCMRILLRNIATGLYFQGPDKWTDKPDGAVDFKFVDRALDYIARWEMTDMEMVFAFDDPPQVTAVSLAKVATRYAHA
jgi:hypothetical protein